MTWWQWSGGTLASRCSLLKSQINVWSQLKAAVYETISEFFHVCVWESENYWGFSLRVIGSIFVFSHMKHSRERHQLHPLDLTDCFSGPGPFRSLTLWRISSCIYTCRSSGVRTVKAAVVTCHTCSDQLDRFSYAAKITVKETSVYCHLASHAGIKRKRPTFSIRYYFIDCKWTHITVEECLFTFKSILELTKMHKSDLDKCVSNIGKPFWLI